MRLWHSFSYTFALTTTGKNNSMNEKLPSPCDRCRATGLFQGADCEQCGGKGYRLISNGQPVPAKRDRPARRFQPKRFK
jgi:DnaJ-class molecular chaperone